MKTLMNAKRMMSVVTMMFVTFLTVAAAEPQYLYNDHVVEGRMLSREVCEKTDHGYMLVHRVVMDYNADGSLKEKRMYDWDAASGSWSLSKTYLYADGAVQMLQADANKELMAQTVKQ